MLCSSAATRRYDRHHTPYWASKHRRLVMECSCNLCKYRKVRLVVMIGINGKDIILERDVAIPYHTIEEVDYISIEFDRKG